MTKSRGVRGAAGGCAVASLVYLLVRGLLTLLVSALMGLAHPGASLAKPLGFSGVKPAHSMEQADQPLLHGIVKIETGGSAFRRTLADGRHHAGDQCGKRVLVPLLCAGGQILIE